ncbi:MAG TPA: hypothetical protein VLR52_03730 [Bacteroidales bacterium]|nr:hypothetical protein [Bacteroidales bacterium]
MNFHNLLVLFITTLFVPCLYAQRPQGDVIYMNNGTFLLGKVIEVIPGQSVKFCVNGTDTLLMQLADVKLIRKEDSLVGPIRETTHIIKTWDYIFMFEVNYGMGTLAGSETSQYSSWTLNSGTLSIFNGVAITPYIFVGLSAGIDFWKTRRFIPLCLDLRFNLLKGPNSPFFYTDLGYAPGWVRKERVINIGGGTAGLGGGAKFRVLKGQLMYVALGYRVQQFRLWQETAGVRSKAGRDARFVNLKIGLMF